MVLTGSADLQALADVLDTGRQTGGAIPMAMAKKMQNAQRIPPVLRVTEFPTQTCPVALPADPQVQADQRIRADLFRKGLQAGDAMPPPLSAAVAPVAPPALPDSSAQSW